MAMLRFGGQESIGTVWRGFCDFPKKINRPNRKLFPNFRPQRLTNAEFVIQ